MWPAAGCGACQWQDESLLFLESQSEWKMEILIALDASRSLIDGDGADKDQVQETNGIGVCVDTSSYKLRYEEGSEDSFWRVRIWDEEELRARAGARATERGRTRWLR